MPAKTAQQIPISIIGVEEDANLCFVNWNQKFLDKAKYEHNLKHRQAILYINKARNRFRLVACFFGLAVLILPPVNAEDRISLHLKVSQFLKRFSNMEDIVEKLDSEIELAEVKIKRRKELAKKVIARRGKK